MRVRVTNPHSDFCGEGGEVLRFFPPKGRSGSTYLVALDSGEAGYEGAMAFGDSEVMVLDEPSSGSSDGGGLVSILQLVTLETLYVCRYFAALRGDEERVAEYTAELERRGVEEEL